MGDASSEGPVAVDPTDRQAVIRLIAQTRMAREEVRGLEEQKQRLTAPADASVAADETFRLRREASMLQLSEKLAEANARLAQFEGALHQTRGTRSELVVDPTAEIVPGISDPMLEGTIRTQETSLPIPPADVDPAATAGRIVSGLERLDTALAADDLSPREREQLSSLRSRLAAMQAMYPAPDAPAPEAPVTPAPTEETAPSTPPAPPAPASPEAPALQKPWYRR